MPEKGAAFSAFVSAVFITSISWFSFKQDGVIDVLCSPGTADDRA
jgi:hypothetical protein